MKHGAMELFCASALAGAMGCGGAPAPPETPAPPPTAPAEPTTPEPAAEVTAPLPPVEVTRAGAPLELKSMLAYTTGGQAITLVGTSAEVGCAQLKEGISRHLGETDTHFRLHLAERIDADGKTEWRILGSFYESYTRQGDQGGAEVERGKGEIDAKLEVELEAAGSEPRPLSVKGTLRAKDCGDVPVEAADRPQPTAKLSVAGHALAVRGAVVTRRSSDVLVTLGTGRLGCRSAGFFESDVTFSVMLDPKSLEPKTVSLRGYRLARQHSDGPKQLSVKLGGPVEGDGEVAVTLEVKQSVGGMPVEASGLVNAIRCEG